MYAKSALSLVGYDPNEVIDSTDLKESALDEPIGEEIIEVAPNSNEEENDEGEN